MKRLLLLLALVAAFLGLAPGAPASAAVTNCSKYQTTSYAVGSCTGTTAYAPYTTRFALMLYCSNGRTYTSGYIKAGYSTAYVACPAGKTRVGNAWFLFA